jgi:hypothetical protein
MNYNPQFVPLEIDPIIPDPEPMKNPAGAFEFAEWIRFSMHQL